jgi:hypothetical protein
VNGAGRRDRAPPAFTSSISQDSGDTNRTKRASLTRVAHTNWNLDSPLAAPRPVRCGISRNSLTDWEGSHVYSQHHPRPLSSVSNQPRAIRKCKSTPALHLHQNCLLSRVMVRDR